MTTPTKLPLAWLKGCQSPEDKASREQLIRNSVQFSTLLMAVLGDKYNQIERKGLREEDYSDTSWMTLQAFRNGKMAMLEEILDLFNFLDHKDH